MRTAARLASLALVSTLGAGCAAARLPYRPAEPPAGIALAAGYQVEGDRLVVEIESEGHRVEAVDVLRPDGRVVSPRALEPLPPRGGRGWRLGFGLGGGFASGGDVGVGTGLVLAPGGRRAASRTRATFDREAVGPPPWRLQLKVVGIQAIDIVLPPR